MKTKPKCSLLATKVGWRVKDAAGRTLTITEIDNCGYRWCDRIGKNRYLQKFTVAGDPLLNAAQNEYVVKVFPPVGDWSSLAEKAAALRTRLADEQDANRAALVEDRDAARMRVDELAGDNTALRDRVQELELGLSNGMSISLPHQAAITVAEQSDAECVAIRAEVATLQESCRARDRLYDECSKERDNLRADIDTISSMWNEDCSKFRAEVERLRIDRDKSYRNEDEVGAENVELKARVVELETDGTVWIDRFNGMVRERDQLLDANHQPEGKS